MAVSLSVDVSFPAFPDLDTLQDAAYAFAPSSDLFVRRARSGGDDVISFTLVGDPVAVVGFVAHLSALAVAPGVCGSRNCSLDPCPVFAGFAVVAD